MFRKYLQIFSESLKLRCECLVREKLRCECLVPESGFFIFFILGIDKMSWECLESTDLVKRSRAHRFSCDFDPPGPILDHFSYSVKVTLRMPRSGIYSLITFTLHHQWNYITSAMELHYITVPAK